MDMLYDTFFMYNKLIMQNLYVVLYKLCADHYAEGWPVLYSEVNWVDAYYVCDMRFTSNPIWEHIIHIVFSMHC